MKFTLNIYNDMFTFMLLLFSLPIVAMDHIRYESGQSPLDARNNYKEQVLRMALEHTVATYGPYKITNDAPRMNPLQARKQLQTGKLLNVFIAITNDQWEKETLAIKIPVRKGLLNYRLLLIHKDDLALFAKIKTLEELKKPTVGLLYGWSITKVMSEQGFSVKKGTNYDGIFKMLNLHRFDFLPRGVNEIFTELEQRQTQLKNVVIEPNLVLHIPAPSYIFVSPKHPRIAQRLQEGFELMIKDGSFDTLFHRYFDDNIRKANLGQRVILQLENNSLSSPIPLQRSELWFTP